MAKFCPYCGNPVKESDKFCIVCGRPLLSKSSKNDKKPPKEEPKQQEEDTEPIIEEEPDPKEEIEEKSEDKEENEGEYEVEDLKKKEISFAEPLPDDVKHQIDLYIQSTEINLKKDVLKNKLNDVLKATKDPKYETDFEFKKITTSSLKP